MDIELPFKTETFAKAWAEWLQYRYELKVKKYTPTGLKRTFVGLFEVSEGNEETAIAMLDQSMKQNWQGIFPLKNNLVNGIINYKGDTKPTDRGTSADRINKASEW